MTAPPFTIPLTPEQFTAALHKGLGRAWMHAHHAGLNGMEDAVLDACLHARSYDPQCEGGREEWLFDILTAPMAPASLAATLVQRLSEPTEEYWDTSQRTGLAKHLARRGFDAAREYLYDSLRRRPDSADVIGIEDIIALDGADGLIHVATQLGEMLHDDPAFWSNDAPLDYFDESHGEGAARRILDDAAAHSPPVAVYLRHIDARETSGDQPKRRYIDPANVRLQPDGATKHANRMRAISAEAIIHEIETAEPSRGGFWFMGWGRHADESSLTQIVDLMLRESHPGRLAKYLRVFDRRALSAFDARMLSLADHPDSEVRRRAHRALSNYAQPDVRTIALRKLGAGHCSECELLLLKLNLQPSDASLIDAILVPPSDRHALHCLVFDLASLFETHPVAALCRAMLFVYEQSPCSNCRCNAVKALLRAASAPAWLFEECKHDSEPEITDLVSKTDKTP